MRQRPKDVPNAERCELSSPTFICQYPEEASSFEKKQAPDICQNFFSAVGRRRCCRFIALFKS